MTYVPGYEFDLFVSYAHVDNAAFEPADHGWVDALIRILKSNLAMKLGRADAFSIWKDSQNLRGNYEIHEEVPEQVRNSALFLAILSPGYLASEFCLQELEAFLEKADIGVGKRLFVVYKDEIGERRNIIPESFRDLRKYQFWLVDSDQKPRLLGSPLPRDDSFEDRRYYYPKVGDLAADIVVKLEELREDKDRSCESNFPAVHTRSQEKRVHVLLAEVADDLEPRREDVRRYLDLAGIGCLPEGSYRLGRADFEPAFLADIDRCKAFVQLLGPLAGKAPPDVPEGFGRLQYNLAKSRNIPIVQWRSPDLNIEKGISNVHRALLQLETVQATPFEEFKRSIVDQLTKVEPTNPARAPFLFVNAAPADIQRANALAERLDSFDCDMPDYEPSDKAEAIQNQIEPKLIECDALIVLYGQAGRHWVESQLQQYRKISPRRRKEPRLLAVVNALNEPPDMITIRPRGMKTFQIDEAVSRIEQAFAV
jgi:hypothetical protein